MKKMIILFSFILTTSLIANKYDIKSVEDYHKVAVILSDTMNTLNLDNSTLPDAERYALIALDSMKKKNMDMNSFLASDVYYTLSLINYKMGGDIYSDDKLKIKKYKTSTMYMEKVVKIRDILTKKDPSYYGKSLKDAKRALTHCKNKLSKTQKNLSK